MKIQNVKGGYDFLPNEQKVRDYISETITKNFKLYGFNSIETPILCYYDILSDKYDENSDILNEIYRLKDQGLRDLGLRYDLTVPFAKFIFLNKNKISLPFKRYEISKVFRDGPVKVGRDREFTQCDADIVGIEGEFIEAELLTLFIKTFKDLDIEINIKYNNLKLMKGLIKDSGIEEEKIPSVIAIIDKKEKVSENEFEEMLTSIGIDIEKIKRLNNNFSKDLKTLNKERDNINLKEGIEELENLTNYIKELGIDNICKIDLTLARGQNYYTGSVFEVYDKKKRITGSIAAGGRYDNMITDFINDGNKYPAAGISFGLTGIYEILKNEKSINETPNSNFYIIPMNTKIESLKVANELRDLSYNVEVELTNKKLKKCLEYADKNKIKYVIVIGSNEIEKNQITIKNMFNKKSIDINLDNLINIKEFLNKIDY